MLDGEAVAHCLEGLPDFHQLLGDGQATACFYAFDLLWLEAQDLRGVELIGRRRMVQKALKKAGPALRFSEHLDAAQGEAMFRQACGVVLVALAGSVTVSSPANRSLFDGLIDAGQKRCRHLQIKLLSDL